MPREYSSLLITKTWLTSKLEYFCLLACLICSSLLSLINPKLITWKCYTSGKSFKKTSN
ncbi:hypothetical protein [Spiroplasma endosymbiont of Polydrusus pterygomalis]|uniref:hypothetical protein n=1 Tax=Spiroplasma endosymbiont of Polydrusus pterygomalis TaxID=3139327 RepID=UPI003CCAEDAD